MADREREKSASDASSRGTQGASSRRLEDWSFYHGILSSAETEQLLTKDGQWLIRLRTKDEKQLILSIFWKGKVHHLALKQYKSKGWLGPDDIFYPNIVTMVQKLRKMKVPLMTNGAVIRSACPKPAWKLRNENVVLEKKIGSGAFGEVWAGKLRYKNVYLPVAIKVAGEQMSDDVKQEMIEEAKRMLHFLHRNVVRFIGLVTDSPPIKLVMENCPGGSLQDYLCKNSPNVTEAVKLAFCADGARGMYYLSSKHNVVHRDLAARNVLIGVRGEAKIADFGMSKVGKFVSVNLKERLPIKWMAPESMKSKAFEFTTKSDVWSFGVLIWEVFNDGSEPWPSLTNKLVRKAVLQGRRMDIPSTAPDPVQTLLAKCWEQSPDCRPTFKDISDILNKLRKEVATSSESSAALSSEGSNTNRQKRKHEAKNISEERTKSSGGSDKDLQESNTAPSEEDQRTILKPLGDPEKSTDAPPPPPPPTDDDNQFDKW